MPNHRRSVRPALMHRTTSAQRVRGRLPSAPTGLPSYSSRLLTYLQTLPDGRSSLGDRRTLNAIDPSVSRTENGRIFHSVHSTNPCEPLLAGLAPDTKCKVRGEHHRAAGLW